MTDGVWLMYSKTRYFLVNITINHSISKYWKRAAGPVLFATEFASLS